MPDGTIHYLKPESSLERLCRQLGDSAAAHRDRHNDAEEYAGKNPFAHYGGPVQSAGMRGAAEIFCALGTPNHNKYLAGKALVSARLNRRLGYHHAARQCLQRASALRQQAQEWGQA